MVGSTLRRWGLRKGKPRRARDQDRPTGAPPEAHALTSAALCHKRGPAGTPRVRGAGRRGPGGAPLPKPLLAARRGLERIAARLRAVLAGGEGPRTHLVDTDFLVAVKGLRRPPRFSVERALTRRRCSWHPTPARHGMAKRDRNAWCREHAALLPLARVPGAPRGGTAG